MSTRVGTHHRDRVVGRNGLVLHMVDVLKEVWLPLWSSSEMRLQKDCRHQLGHPATGLSLKQFTMKSQRLSLTEDTHVLVHGANSISYASTRDLINFIVLRDAPWNKSWLSVSIQSHNCTFHIHNIYIYFCICFVNMYMKTQEKNSTLLWNLTQLSVRT